MSREALSAFAGEQAARAENPLDEIRFSEIERLLREPAAKAATMELRTKKKTTLYLPTDVHTATKAEALERGVSMTELVADALRALVPALRRVGP